VVDADHGAISIARQCELLGISRSGYYYRPVGVSDEDLACMRVMDEIFTKRPYFGSRRLRDEVAARGYPLGRDHVRRLMRGMGLEAIYPKRRLTVRDGAQRVYPYLLRNLTIARPDHVWCSDITYIRLKAGFAYLVAVMDWCSRYVLSWELSMSLESQWCVWALEEALSVSRPEIFNSDQGCQYTSEPFRKVLLEAGIGISMDGRGRAFDNIMVERLWRTVKYEEVFLKDYAHLFAARESLGEYFEFYNNERRHSALEGRTPSAVYWNGRTPARKAAAERRVAAATPLRATPSAPLQPPFSTGTVELIQGRFLS
jgi:putative transposase